MRRAVYDMTEGFEARLVQLINDRTQRIRDEMAHLSSQNSQISNILADILADTALIKQVQTSQGLQLQVVQSDMNNMKQSFRSYTHEVSHIGVLLEDLDYRFSAGGELSGAE